MRRELGIDYFSDATHFVMSPPTPSPDQVSQERVVCNLCGADDTRELYRKPDTRFWTCETEWPVVECRRCGLGYVSPRPAPGAMAEYYPSSFYKNREVSRQRTRYELQASFLADLEPGKLLDIGCATGAYMEVMAERGWSVEGMDQFAKPSASQFPIRIGSLPDLAYPSDHFDAITSWAVFEHLHDPGAYFREVGRILRPGGWFVFLVTNLRSIWSRWAYQEDIPRHLYFFSRKTLARYGGTCGLTLEDVDVSGRIMKPDSTDVFRIQMLRFLGTPWREILHPPETPAGPLGFALKVASKLGHVLFSGNLEARLGIGGLIVARMRKTLEAG